MKRIGIIGARGYTGGELIGLLQDHGGFELAFVSSRSLAGQPLRDHVDVGDLALRYERLEPGDVEERQADCWILALPNGLSAPWVDAIDRHQPGAAVVDLSGDHRFDDAWTYGLTERHRARLREASRISNPGCYATGMQMALLPLIEGGDGEDLVDGLPQCFGVSGYSGAGTTPSPKNDPEALRDNLMPYKLQGHQHEAEVGRQLGRPVRFLPHVAPFFRGITLTISVTLKRRAGLDELRERYQAMWGREPLVELTDEAPLVRDNAGRHLVRVGGMQLSEDGRHLAVVATLDNLLKGAATQALQNANLACDFDELTGITT